MKDYQRAAVQHIKDVAMCGLFLDMGLGKTVSTLTAFDDLKFEELDVSRALVIAPKRVAEHVWPAEVKTWKHLSHLRVSVISGTARQRAETLKADADIYTVGRDNVAWLCAQYGGGALPFDMLVIDESSSFKNHDTVRFRSLRNVLNSFRHVVILTGTPAPNSLLDLWPQVFLLDRGQRLERTVTGYREKYFTAAQRNGHVVYKYALREGAAQEIYNAVGDVCLSMKASDYLDLRAPVVNDVVVHMDDATLARFKEFEREQVLEMFEHDGQAVEVTALNAAALANKLLQFGNGAIYEEGGEVVAVHDAKLDELEDILENLQGANVLVAWAYRHDRDRIAARLKKYKPRELKTPKDIDDWNAGKIRVLLMHPASGGHGLNLQFGGHHIVWFGHTWSSELYQQLNARLNRPGQPNACVITRLITEGGLDRDVLNALAAKQEGEQALMGALKYRIDRVLKSK